MNSSLTYTNEGYLIVVTCAEGVQAIKQIYKNLNGGT